MSSAQTEGKLPLNKSARSEIFSPPPRFLHPFCSYHLSGVAFSQCHLPFAGRWRAALYCLLNNSLQFAVRYFFRTPLIPFFFSFFFLHLLLLIFSLHTICVCSPKLFIFLKAWLRWYFSFECPFLHAKPSLALSFPQHPAWLGGRWNKLSFQASLAVHVFPWNPSLLSCPHNFGFIQ